MIFILLSLNIKKRISLCWSLDIASIYETVLFWISVNQAASDVEENNHNLGDETVWFYSC